MWNEKNNNAVICILLIEIITNKFRAILKLWRPSTSFIHTQGSAGTCLLINWNAPFSFLKITWKVKITNFHWRILNMIMISSCSLKLWNHHTLKLWNMNLTVNKDAFNLKSLKNHKSLLIFFVCVIKILELHCMIIIITLIINKNDLSTFFFLIIPLNDFPFPVYSNWNIIFAMSSMNVLFMLIIPWCCLYI